MLQRIRYFAEKGFDSLRESSGISLLTTGTICVSLLLLGSYLMALQNLEGLALVWGRSATVTAYIDDAIAKKNWDSINLKIQDLDKVRRTELITPKKALENFRARGKGAAALVDGVSQDILPASIEVNLKGGFADLKKLEILANEIQSIGGVSEVDYGREEFDRLEDLLEVLRIGGFVSGLLIALATALIISNTIKLIVYGRKEEIAILQLVGATSWFIRTPFLFEGALWGLAGGILSAGLLWVADILFAPKISMAISDIVGGLDVKLFSTDVGIGMVIAGLVLGIFGSVLALRRFLALETT